MTMTRTTIIQRVYDCLANQEGGYQFTTEDLHGHLPDLSKNQIASALPRLVDTGMVRTLERRGRHFLYEFVEKKDIPLAAQHSPSPRPRDPGYRRKRSAPPAAMPSILERLLDLAQDVERIMNGKVDISRVPTTELIAELYKRQQRPSKE